MADPAAPAAPTTGDPTAAVQQLLGQSDVLQGQIDKANTDPGYVEGLQKLQGGQQSAIAAVRESMKSAEGQKFAGLPSAPDMKIKQASGARIVGAILAGLVLGRAAKVGGWDTAASALSNTVKNWREGQMDKAQSNFAEYKTAVEKIKYQNEQSRAQLDMVLEHAKTNLTLADSELNNWVALHAQALQPLMDKQKSIQDKIKLAETTQKMLNDKQHALDEHAETLGKSSLMRAQTGKELADTNKTNIEADREKRGLPPKPSVTKTGRQQDALATRYGMTGPDGTANPEAVNLTSKEAADANKLTDEYLGARKIAGFLSDPKNADKATELAKTLSQSQGTLLSWAGSNQDSSDAFSAAYAKQILKMQQLGARVLTGGSGRITVYADRRAGDLFKNASPETLRQVMNDFSQDFEDALVNDYGLDPTKLSDPSRLGNDFSGSASRRGPAGGGTVIRYDASGNRVP